MADDLNYWDGSKWISLRGPQGVEGPPGKDGSGVTIVGTLTGTSTPLPPASEGEMYILGDPVPSAAPASQTGPAVPGDGIVFDGSIWTNVGPIRGPVGPQGPKGDTGNTGTAASIVAGTTTTLAPGSNATVTNSGTSSAAKFDFGIPRGATGATGSPGAAATIASGTATSLPPGSNPTVTNSGSSSAAVFNFGIPQGAKGDTGATGPQGPAGQDGETPVEVFKASAPPSPTAGKALSFWVVI